MSYVVIWHHMIYYTMMLDYLMIYDIVECSMYNILRYNRTWCDRIKNMNRTTDDLIIVLWYVIWYNGECKFKLYHKTMNDPSTQCDCFVWRMNKEWYTICYTFIRTLPLDSRIRHTPYYDILSYATYNGRYGNLSDVK